MKIRAVTLGVDLPAPIVEVEPFRRASEFLRRAADRFAGIGVEVQTTRASGGSLAGALRSLDGDGLVRWSVEVEARAGDAGISYLSFGLVPSDRADVVETTVPEMLARGEIGFVSADLLDRGIPSPSMAAACAKAVKSLAESTPLGFGNLRFAAIANCPPNIPFFPAAYHRGGEPRFAIAVQAADVVLRAAQGEGSILEVEQRIVDALEGAARPIEALAEEIAREEGVPFVGIDLSPAPFPSDDESIAGALESIGVDSFGAPGTLFAAALVTRAIRRTRIKRTGFSGLMLPVLEDSVLAKRSAEHPRSLHELLLYSAVCGTGLDTVPLPADIGVAELAGAYLDVAALSVALNGKPLTVRLLPVPNANSGDSTTYDFEYFHNTRIPPAMGAGASGLLMRGL